ncbi:hypothetical protein [Nannocystis pusilla]|uniref:hypothetical protein n=1 Tax=Nannocystis pusilla TaxID=889268 RepID=UPI003B7C2728
MPAPTPVTPCDMWNDTCPEGQKCHPYEQDGGWAAGCMEVADPPVPIGGQCNLLWGDLKDDCERGAMCFGLGIFAESKRCTPLATGSADAAVCADPCSQPFVYFGLFGLCTPPCDPLGDDCPEGVVCIRLRTRRSSCARTRDRPATTKRVKTPTIAWRSTCVVNVVLPNCGSTRCCTPLCELNAPDPCPAAIADTACQTWPYLDLNACLPPGLGLCSKPLDRRRDGALTR